MATIRQGQWESAFKKAAATFDKDTKAAKGDKGVDAAAKAMSKPIANCQKELKVCDKTLNLYLASDAEDDDQMALFKDYYSASDNYAAALKSFRSPFEKNVPKKAAKGEPAAYASARELFTLADEIGKQQVELKFAIEIEIRRGARKAKKGAVPIEDLAKSAKNAIKRAEQLVKDDVIEEGERDPQGEVDNFLKDVASIAKEVFDACREVERYRKKGAKLAIETKETKNFQKWLTPFLKKQSGLPKAPEQKHFEKHIEIFTKVLEKIEDTAKDRAKETKAMADAAAKA